MGNMMPGSRKETAKVMKMNGSTFHLKTPALAGEVLWDHPGYDLLEFDKAKRLGLQRTQPLMPYHPLGPGKLYFLVELPGKRTPLLHTSVLDRRESAKLLRSVSNHSLSALEETEGGIRVGMRVPKTEVMKLVRESKDGAEAAKKVMKFCMVKKGSGPAPARN